MLRDSRDGPRDRRRRGEEIKVKNEGKTSEKCMFLVGFIFDILLILSLTSKRKAVISKRRATDFKFLLDVIGNFKPK